MGFGGSRDGGRSDDPPPYEDVVASGSARSSLIVPHQPDLSPGNNIGEASSSSPIASYPGPIPQQFPPIFSFYKDRYSLTITIAPHQRTETIYAVSRYYGGMDKPAVQLHCGPNATFPIIAAAELQPFTRDRLITLPPLPGSPETPTEVQLRAEDHFLTMKWCFRIEAGFPGKPESYEWRCSGGAAVCSLGVDWARGWKLVRLEKGPPDGAPPGTKFCPGEFVTSDGWEVVAMWALSAMNLSRGGVFAFNGTGASGLLGERWAVMAVISALAIVDFEARRL